MPPYFILALLWSLIWCLLFMLRKNMRQKMLIMSVAVIPFAFFDYFSQPSYWHPQTILSIPVGIEGMLFGFSFGGVASVLHSTGTNKNGPINPSIEVRNIILLSPVLIVSIGLYVLLNVNMMISLPVGLLTGCLLIIAIKPGLTKRLLYSGIYFGLLYLLVLSVWLVLFPQAQQWWDLSIYGGITIINVPLGEVLFGFLFSAFWGVAHEFIFSHKSENAAEPVWGA